VIGAVAFLLYFGIFSKYSFVPERCYLPEPLVCKEYKVSAANVELTIQNNLDKDIFIKKINISDCAGNNINKNIKSNKQERFNINCNLEEKEILDSKLIIIYDEVDGLLNVEKEGIIVKRI